MNEWIPLARIAREHGLTKGETSYLKCDLLQAGGLSFFEAKEFAFSKSTEQSAPKDIFNYTEAPKPLGGSWGHAKAVILPIPKTYKWTRGDWVLLRREAFPKIPDSEVYLCDLMGALVCEQPAQASTATVVGIQDRSVGRAQALSLVVEIKNSSNRFEVPLRSIDWSQSTEKLLVIPTLKDWANL